MQEFLFERAIAFPDVAFKEGDDAVIETDGEMRHGFRDCECRYLRGWVSTSSRLETSLKMVH